MRYHSENTNKGIRITISDQYESDNDSVASEVTAISLVIGFIIFLICMI